MDVDRAERAMTPFTRIGTTPTIVRVLVVEDSASDARLAAIALEQATLHRFRSTAATTIAAALPLLDDTEVVLLDLHLPDADHLDGLRQIRARRPDLPVIILTGDATAPTTAAALRAGAQDYLLKDELDGVVLDRAIAHAIARQELVGRLEASERWARALVHSVSDVISIHGTDGEIQHLGGQGATPLPWSDPPAMEDLRPHVDRPTWLRMLRAFRRWRRIGFGSLDFTVRLPDGSERHLESVATDMLDDPTIRGIVVTTRDVTDRHVIADRLAHEATHDALTDLPNRTLFHERLRTALARQRRSRDAVAVLMIDLDDFKNINDSYGHPAGDEVLRSVSSLLTVGLRAEDTLARLSGDEFAIVCPDVDAAAAERLARRLQRTLVRPFSADGHHVFLSASIGIAVSSPPSFTDATDLLRNADLALYQSKAAGRSCVSIFDERLERRAVRRMEVETELRGALLRRELSVAYQPLVDLRTGRVHSHEALLRWRHPDLGEVSPEEFIPIAEDCGLIVTLGRWVLERACIDLAEWRRADPFGDGCVAVNVSARQLVDPSFVPELLDVLQRTDVPASALSLEVTETALIADMADSSEALRRLRSLGMRVALDDFGTGYSSLGYLKRLPVDVLKIDRSFVEDIGHSVHDQALVGGVTRMAKALGLEVVAEGVEDEAQRDQLLALGCDQAQGFLFSRPVTHEEVLRTRDVVHEITAGALPERADIEPLVSPPVADPSAAIADLVHELMQPLTVITSYAESFRLLVGADDLDGMTAVADAISRNSLAAVTIVRSLADTGALERGSLQLECEPVAVAAALRDLIGDLQRTTDVAITLEVGADVVAELDLSRFRQIVTNLVTNAAKFAPPETPIVVRVTISEAGGAVVSVIDSGPGVPTELRPDLFEKYRRHGQQRGTGIGLYIAQQLARLHGGELRYRRAHTGGAEFELTLPTASSTVVAAPVERPLAGVSATTRATQERDDPAALVALHRATRDLLRAGTPERVVSISIGLVRELGGSVVPAAFADAVALPVDLAMGHGPPLLPSAPPLTVARLRLERLLPLFVEDARDAMQTSRGLGPSREFDPVTGLRLRWPLERTMSSIRDQRDVLVAQAPDDAEDRRTLARVLRSVSDPDDVIGAWDDDLLVVVRGGAAADDLLVHEVEDEWFRWGGTTPLALTLVRSRSAGSVEDVVRSARERLTGAP